MLKSCFQSNPTPPPLSFSHLFLSVFSYFPFNGWWGFMPNKESKVLKKIRRPKSTLQVEMFLSCIILWYIDVGHCLKFWYGIFSHVFKPWETSTVLLLPRPLKNTYFLSNRYMNYYDQNQDCHSWGFIYSKRNAIIYNLKVHECLVKLLWLNLPYQIMILNLIRQVTWDKIFENRIR